MNKVFKVIWNHATQSWVAVSELTSAKGKTKSKTSTLTALSVAVGSAMAAGSALAAVSGATSTVEKTINQAAGATISGTTTGIYHLSNGSTAIIKSDGSASPTNIIVIGNRSDNIFDNQILIGHNISSIAYGKVGDTVVGNRVQLGGGANGDDSFSTAVGFGTQVAGPSVAIGVGARSDILDASGWNATKNAGVAIGAFALQGGNINGGTVIGGLASGDYHYATSIGALSGVTGTFEDKATGTGYSIQESSNNAFSNVIYSQTSVGYKAGARARRSVAIGNCATTGVAHTTLGTGSVAIGDQSQSFKDGSIAIGQQAVAGGVTAAEITALNTEITRLDGLLTNATNDLANATANLTANPSADNKYSVAAAQSAIQRITLAKERAQRDLAKASVNNSTTTTAMAIGFGAHANNLNTTAIGRASASYAESSISLGRAAGVTGANATRGMALGDGAAVTGDSAVNATAIGAGANIRQNSTNAIAFGTNASVVGDAVGSSNSIAIGNQTAAGNRNARWGANSARALTFLAAQNATAVGSESIAGGNNSAAFGYKNVINAPNSTAVGFNNTVGSYSGQTVSENVASANYVGLNTHVIGANNNVTANNTMVFGNNIRVTEANRSGGVVIGDNSSLPTNTTAVNSASVNNITYSGFAGNLGGSSTDGTSELASDQGRFVSIGNTTSPRQLKHVAAGEIGPNSTDAINGSQLYLLTSVVGNVGSSVANVIGGNATMYANGTVANFTQPLNVTGLATDEDYTAPKTDADKIADAITNLNNYVNAGWIVGNNTATKVARISPNEQVNFLNGTATSAVATANGTGADITYNVNVDNTTIAVNGTSNQLTVNTTTLSNNANGSVVTPGANASSLVNASQVAAAINNSGWNTTTKDGDSVTINPGDAVNYVNGNGTAANVTVNTTSGAVEVSYDVNTTTGSVIANGTATVTNGSAFLNASTVANLVNNAAFNVTTAKNDVFVTNQEGKANVSVKAGGNITYTAGKNIAIKQDGSNFTFATEQNVTFTNANVTNTLAIGNASSTSSPVVNIKTENATTANVSTTPATAALNVTSADGNATQIKGVASSLNTTTVTTFPDGTTDPTDTTTATSKQLLNLGTDDAPLSDSVLNSVVTVRDLTNLGWVVSAADNNYTDTVKNANEVKFNGVNGITVTGNTTDGVRNINISANTTTLTSNANGSVVVPTSNASSLVNASTVANAINNSGWNTTAVNATTGASEAVTVNPGDTVNYVNGNGTSANVTVAKDANGKDVVSVSYDVNSTTGTVNPNGTVSVTDGNSFLNASTVANLVNNAAFNVTTAKNDVFVTNQEGKANVSVKAGGNITYTAGKNIAIKQDGSNFTFATEQNVTFTNANVTSTLAIGNASSTSSPVVNLKTENATTASVNNNTTTAPSSALNITSADGKATQIKGVASSLNTTTVNTYPAGNADGSTAATEKQLLNLGNETNPLSESVLNSVVTVRDLTNFGWVVSANGNNYTDTVKNANEVKFNGVNGITVTGNTTDGVRNINISLNTTNITSNANGTTSVTSGDSYVNASTVSNAINNAGWNTTAVNATTGASEAVTVNPGDTVNYVNGNGTSANVTVAKDANGKDVVSVSYDVNSTTGTVNPNGTVSVTDGNSFLNASTVANLVNNAAFNVTTAKNDVFVTNQEGKANVSVKAGGNITYTAGKNIAIKQDGSNFTFATEQNVTFTNANVTSTLAIGNASSTSSPVVNLKTENATTASVNNNTTTAPTSALNITSADGKATQIKGVASSLNTTTVNTYPAGNADGSTAATEKQLLNLGNETNPLSESVLNSVVTVRDLTNFGWVVSANGNNYTDTVKNANEVKFNGVNGITVTGNTTDGVRNINISLNTTNITSNANGTTSVTNDSSYVNASTVSNAINNAGWKTTAVNATTGTSETVTVNPGDTVNYVNSSTATANVTVSKDANGKDVVNVTYDVNTGSITAADSNATITVTNDDGTTSTVANSNRGKVTVEKGQGDKVATVQNVADAINSAKWIASVEETGEEIATSTEEDAGVAIGAGDELSFKAGKNLKIKRDGQEITYALANDINVTTVTATGNITVGTGDNATTINQGSITNLNDHLTAPTNATSSVANATATTMPSNVSTIGNQAATVNDVINAGWNLQANDNAVDAVTHGNTVNFVSTDRSVTITPTTDGSTSKLDFAVNATSIVNQVKGTIGYNNGTATTTGDDSRVATVGEVKDAINNTGWTVSDQYGATHLVTPLQPVVRYVNGNGTTAKVDVVDNNGTPEVNISYSVAQNKAGTQNANGTVTLADAANGTSTFLNAQDTVNLINSASFNVTTAKVDSFVTNQEGKENKAVKAGETITYTAGKNIAIKQDGANFTFATEQNVTFTNANVTGTLAIGGDNNSPVVNISTGTGEHNNNGTTTSPNTVNMGNAQLTNVSAGANVYGANVDENGKPLTAVTVRNAAGQDEIKYYTADQFEANGALKSGATASTPVAANNVSKAVSGLADLASSNATNVMTVADAKNLGWVVSASDNDYADKVQNANQVNFKAEANTGVTVKGATNATTGVREIVVGNDYFKANATAGSTAANAAGSNSVAVGPNSVANTAGSVAIGNGANVTTSAPAGSVAIGQGATAGAVNTGAYRIDGSTDVAGAPNASTRVFSVGNASSPAQIQNVAAGVVSATSTDAVNGSQLHATNQAVINNARAIGNLNNKIDQVDKRGRKGTAIAGAIGMLPQPHISGKSMVSAATTNYRGEQAVAVGYSRLSDNGKHIIKLSGSSNVSGKKDAMVGASYGYQW